MKKILAMILALVMVLSLCACNVEKAPDPTKPAPTQGGNEPVATEPVATEPAAEKVEISLWTYPIGKWVDEATVADLIADFNAVYPNITV